MNKVNSIRIHPAPQNRAPMIQPIFCPQNIQSLSPSPPSQNDLEMQSVCISCQKWLRRQVKIEIQNKVYCVGCFAAEMPECEQYQVKSHNSFQLLGGGWPARDELLMMEAIEKFGFGNWTAVQEYMRTLGANYYKDQIQTHYDKFYTQQMISKTSENIEKIRVSNPSRKNKKNNIRCGKSIQKSTAYSLYRLSLQKQEIPCYNSKRGEFNIDYKQNLQKMIADIEFRDNDSPRETELKFQILQAYNQGLQDRYQKHQFILQHKLLDENYQKQQEQYLKKNTYANKAHELLQGFMRNTKFQEYLELRKDLQFCLKIQTLVDNLRYIRSSNLFCSLKGLGKMQKVTEESPEQMSKPKKKVHRDRENSREEQQKNILKKMNVTKEQLKIAIQQAREQKQTIFYKDIRITPLKNLVQQSK